MSSTSKVSPPYMHVWWKPSSHNNNNTPLYTIPFPTQTMTTTTTFAQFYDSWFDQFHCLVQQLNTPNQTDAEELIRKVMSHHEDYYNAKSMAAEKDPLHVLASPWATTLERSLYWIAGWRPTTAFHLIYTESSLLFESHIIDILRGLRTGDLGDLSPTQFRRVSDLQCDTVSNSFFFLFKKIRTAFSNLRKAIFFNLPLIVNVIIWVLKNLVI